MNIARFSKSTPCYICGRDTGGKCGISQDTNLLHCWAIGDRFAPPSSAVRKRGSIIKGKNGLDYAFVGMSGSCEEWATFKVHEEVAPVERSWTYNDLDGEPCVVVHRTDRAGRGKSMWQSTAGKHPKVPPRAQILPYGSMGEQTFIVEGEVCCDAVLGLGLSCLTFIGGSGGNPSTLTVTEGQSFILCPDRDDKGLEWMLKVYDHITAAGGVVQWLYANPSSPRWDDPADGYDLGDWISDGATKQNILDAITDTPRTLSTAPSDVGFWESLPRQDKLVVLRPDELQQLILHHAGERLRWNSLTNSLEIDGEEVRDIELSSAYIRFSARNIKVHKEEAITQLITAGHENAFHPVRAYLDSCTVPLDDDTWESIALELLGPSVDDDSPDELNSSLLRKWLISAVARIYEPGQRADFMFVLAGPGSTHKTRFFSTLVGREWFQEGFQDDIKQRDALMKCHRFWVTEMGEVDGMTNKRAAAEVKNFITTKLDALRAPYGRAVEMHKRQFVLCATTNRTDGFLVDETGNRRFVVYTVKNRINLKRIEQLRDRIWASAVRDYRNGVDWNMTPEEMSRNELRNDAWMQDDPWMAPIQRYLSNTLGEYVPEVTTSQLMEHPLEVRKQDQHQGHLMRVGRILKSLGYEKARTQRNGRRVVIWRYAKSPLTYIPRHT